MAGDMVTPGSVFSNGVVTIPAPPRSLYDRNTVLHTVLSSTVHPLQHTPPALKYEFLKGTDLLKSLLSASPVFG